MPGGIPTYIPNLKHRNNSPGQSQWRIPEREELASFEDAWTSGCCTADAGWGLHVAQGCPEYLGVLEDHATESFIAKFVADSAHGQWHGYPADHRKKRQDVPTEGVRMIWLAQRLLPLPKIRKIGKQQRCTL